MGRSGERAMRWLIDGYNVMYAAGRLGRSWAGRVPQGASAVPRRPGRRSPGRDSRRRTVVFDASVPPGDFPISSTYRGLRSSSPWRRGRRRADRAHHRPRLEPQDADGRLVRPPDPPGRRRDEGPRPLTADDFLRPQGPAPTAALRRPTPPSPETDRDAVDWMPTRRPSGSRRSATSTTSPESGMALARAGDCSPTPRSPRSSVRSSARIDPAPTPRSPAILARGVHPW